MRQVKIGQQAVHSAKRVTRRDKQLGLAGERHDAARSVSGRNALCGGFERTNTGCTNRDKTARCRVDDVGAPAVEYHRLVVHDVFVGVVGADGPKGSHADVQGEISQMCALRFDLLQNIRREMQSGSGRGGRPVVLCVDRLVAFFLRGGQRRRDVRRQRRFAPARESVAHLGTGKFQNAPTVPPSLPRPDPLPAHLLAR